MEETVSRIIKRAEKENVDAIAMVHRAEALSIEYENNSLSNTSDGYTDLLEIRISKGKKFGYSLSDNLSKWDGCFESALKLMKVSKPLDRNIVLSKPSKPEKISGIYSKKVAEMPMADMFKKAEDAVDEVKNVREDLSVLSAKFSKSNSLSVFGNTNGTDFSEKGTMMSTLVECGLGTANGTDGSDSRQDLDFVPVARDAARLCVDSIDPKKVNRMKTELILDYFAAADLLQATLVPSLMSDMVQNNKSYLKGKLGKKVFSDKLSVADNALMPGGLFSGRYDCEGSRTSKTELISKGVVKNFLYDMYSAAADKKKTTGSCSSIAKIPSVGTSNFMVQPGAYSRDEIISDTKQGVLAKFVMGTHFVNSITGDASIGLCNAFFVEDGCIRYPVKQAMIFVNIFEALKNIEVIGNNMRQDAPVACPTIKIPGVQIIS